VRNIRTTAKRGSAPGSAILFRENVGEDIYRVDRT